MAKRIKSQNRGKGGPQFLAKNNKSKILDNRYQQWMTESYKILSFKTSKNHSGIFMKVSNGKQSGYLLAPTKVEVGREISSKKLEIGSVVELAKVPIGYKIMNIQFSPSSLSRLVRTAGNYAKIFSRDQRNTSLSLRKGKKISLNNSCICTVGSVAASDKNTIPYLRAGKKINSYHKKAYSVSPNKMNAVDHPFGGNSPGCGRNKEIKRTASPGMKVGNIASSRSGIRKRKR